MVTWKVFTCVGDHQIEAGTGASGKSGGSFPAMLVLEWLGDGEPEDVSEDTTAVRFHGLILFSI